MSAESATSTEGGPVEGSRPFSLGPGEGWAAASALGYGLYNFVSGIAVLTASPLVAPVFRMLPTVGFAWHRSRPNWTRLQPVSLTFIGWRVLLVLLVGGVATTVVGNVAHFYALRLGGVVLTAPVIATTLLWSAVFAALFLREPLAPRMLVGVVIAVLGIATLSYGRTAGSEVVANVLPAVLLSLLAAAGWAATNNCSRYALRRGVDTHLTIAAGQSGGVLLLIGLLFLLGKGALLWTTDLQTVGILLLVGVLGTIALVCLTYALSLTTVASATVIGGTNPVIAMVLALVFLGERINGIMALGAVLTLSGVVVFQLSRPRV